MTTGSILIMIGIGGICFTTLLAMGLASTLRKKQKKLAQQLEEKYM